MSQLIITPHVEPLLLLAACFQGMVEPGVQEGSGATALHERNARSVYRQVR